MLRKITPAIFALGLALTIPLLGAKHDTWVEVRSPNFIVVSNAGVKQASKTAVQFEQIRTLFREALAIAAGHPSPVITILALKDENSMREVLPEYFVKGHTRLAGIFLNRMNQFYMAVDLAAQGTNPYETMYHEYYHSLTVPYFPMLPVWTAEGLADFFGNTTITDKIAQMGEADPDLVQELRNTRLIPLDVVFKVDHTSPYYNEQAKTTVFYAESWALTHYFMIGDKGIHRQTLMNYLQALEKGATGEQAAAQAFGDLKKLQDQLSRYIGNYQFYFLQTAAPAKTPESELKVRQLSDAEADANRGGFEAVRGESQLAKTFLDAAVREDPDLGLAYQNLALVEFFDQHRDEALVAANKAVELDPKSGLAHYIRAHLSFFSGKNMANDAQIGEDLRQAIALTPDFPASYALLAVYLAARNENLPEALTMAQKAMSMEPGEVNYQLDLAQVLIHMRRYDEARAVLFRARAAATYPQMRAQADQFLTYLEQSRNYGSGNSAAASRERFQESVEVAPAPSNAREASGMITQESCAGGLKIQVAASSGELTLRIQPGTAFQIMMPSQTPDFNVCTSLKGQRAKVHYIPDDEKGVTGTMVQLQLLSPEGSVTADPASSNGKKTLRLSSDAIVKRADGVTASAEGKVANVSCNEKELELTLAYEDKVLVFHARDYTRISIDEGKPFETGKFKACEDLKGLDAKITYAIIDHKWYDGEIQSIEIVP